jgi:two-component system nitrogen regulation response regulator NtrX
MNRQNILLADDDQRTAEYLNKLLIDAGYGVILASDGEETLRKLQESPIHLLLLDLKMPDPDGLTILRMLAVNRSSTLPVIILSGYGTIKDAVEAMKLGAYDYLEKPLQPDRVLTTVRHALEYAQLSRENAQLRSSLRTQAILVGESPAMGQVRAMIEKVAGARLTVLITGESGTGKEIVAQAIHAAGSPNGGSFVVVNCTAIPDTLIENELFGHARGAYTSAVGSYTGKIQQAHNGTLFLDEIGDMSLNAQTKLLRVLESGEIQPLGHPHPIAVSVRFLAATNKDLKDEIAAGRFRADLFHRLDVIPIHLPPLRERREDIPDLIDHFLLMFCREHGLPYKTFSPEAVRILTTLSWPGNVRELKHAVQKLVFLSDAGEISDQDVREILRLPRDQEGTKGMLPLLKDARREFERKIIMEYLITHHGQIEAAARSLGLDYTYLYKKMKRLGIKTREVSRG